MIRSLLLLISSSIAFAQPFFLGVKYDIADPAPSCTNRSLIVANYANGKVWRCVAGTYMDITGGGGGGGTVTSVGFSTNLGTVTGSPVTTAGTLTNTVSAAQVVGLFSGCSGTQYLGADGACHNASGGSPATLTYCADASGSATTYTCTPSPALGSYTTGVFITFVPQTSNTGASTVNVSGLGAKSVIAANTTGSTLVADDLLAGGVYTLEYDGTNFRKVNGPDGAWTGVSYASSWTDFGSGYQAVQYRKDSRGDVCLRGFAKGGTETSGTTLMNQAAGYRISTLSPFIASASNGAAVQSPIFIDAQTGGAIVLQTPITTGAGSALSLNGFCYSVY